MERLRGERQLGEREISFEVARETFGESRLVELPDPDPDEERWKRIALVRGISREDFARAYGIPVDTLRAWERREADPSPAEVNYLRTIAKAPELVREAVAEPA